jgi:hypothetical protein
MFTTAMPTVICSELHFLLHHGTRGYAVHNVYNGKE